VHSWGQYPLGVGYTPEFADIEWQSGERRYLSEGSMAQLNPTSDTDTTAAIDSGA
jgi:hypothetical protein